MSSNEEKMDVVMQRNMKVLAECIRTSNVLPVGSARNNFNTCFPLFSLEMKSQSEQLLHVISTLLNREGIRQNIQCYDNEEKVDLIVDGVNKILDRIRNNLNTLKGFGTKSFESDPLKSKGKLMSGSWNKDPSKSSLLKLTQYRETNGPVPTVKISEKPQVKFETKVDNSNSPFEPQLSVKPNALKPLSVYLEQGADGNERYCHPYMYELNSFVVPQSQLEVVEPVLPKHFDINLFTYVDDKNELSKLVMALRREKEIAVDLEYHSYRSFQGFTCLLQISTRHEDFIIDAIALRSKLHVLNEIFTNPKILKVFHGAASDVVWLQKDFNLYLVNMFDTHLASLMLDYPRLSLAFLLKHYCNVDADKRYQLFDWRARPLPEAALNYARGDTHYLLYIYDNLRNALLSKANGLTNLLLSVYSRSTDLCKKRHEKRFDENGYLVLYKQSKQTFDNRQMEALKSLYVWRDQIAREKDESTGYVLPNHMMLQIAEILPRELQGVLACCNPVPSLVRSNLAHLHRLIVEARSKSTNKLITRDNRESLRMNKAPVLSKLRCPYDFSYHDDLRDNLTTLFDGSDSIHIFEDDCTLKVSVFDEDAGQPGLFSGRTASTATIRNITFVSPYERYKKTTSFVLSQSESFAEEGISTNPSNLASADHKNEIQMSLDADEKVIVFKTRNAENAVFVSVESDIIPNNDVQRKQPPHNQGSSKKRMSTCNALVDASITPNQFSDLAKELQTRKEDRGSLIPPSEDLFSASHPPKKRKKRANEAGIEKEEGGKQKDTLTPYDYSKTDFRKFASTRSRNIDKLLHSKVSFGTNKKVLNQKVLKGNKGKKRKSNKSVSIRESIQ